MNTTTQSDALERLARRIAALEAQTDVYFLPFDPHHGPSRDHAVHVAVLADVEDARMATLNEKIAEFVQETNVQLDFDPFVVAHCTNRNAALARMARSEGVRL